MKKILEEKELGKVSGGDALDELMKQAAKEKKEEELQKIVEEIEKHKDERNSKELNNMIDDLIHILRKDNENESDGKIHIG